MHCGEHYPDKPPTVQFISQINLSCVNPKNGLVDPTKLKCLVNWDRNMTMETILIELRRFMGHPSNKKLPQPDEGATYH
ncbi:Ubiquitin-conjugating enzyme spm2 [Erysiphe neolycopersici]|uniref:Ubiquitin-conjugating enzyme spm2 n=1 Tax=Erysiphe neolycopersici TaxID=212602 RepID=A0A420HG46_9PEZI|nr:Ubiquitin-conjugating enzyme spm2 [Erysiphe neolycopersici]